MGLSLADRRRELDKLISKVNKEAKHTVLAWGSEAPNAYFLRRPSGITQLDIDTGGGAPAGGLTYLTGPDNAGKTRLLFYYMAMNQRLYGDSSILGYAAVEMAPDYWFMRKCGMQVAIPEEMIQREQAWRLERGLPKFTKEEMANFRKEVGKLVIIRGTGEQITQSVLDCVDSKAFNIIGMDSITALSPAKEMDKEQDDNPKRAANAQLVTQFMNKYMPKTTGLDGLNETSLICTGQVRSNDAKATAAPFMQPYLKDWAPTGAYSARHTKLLDITIWSGANIRVKSGEEKGKIIGKEMVWKISKGKAGCHDNVEGYLEVPYADFQDPLYRELLTTGIKYGAIAEKNQKILVLRKPIEEKGDVGTLMEFPSAAKFQEMMKTDPETEYKVRREVMAWANIHCIYR